jgi:putative membrane protein
MKHRLHPSYIVIGAVSTLRAMALPIIIAIVTGGGFLAVTSYLLVLGIALLGVIHRAIDWWRFTYEVTPRELRVQSGVISRRERTIPLDRIQSVDINESLLQRLFGVVRVRIESAASGGKGADVTLDAVSRRDAAALRSELTAVTRGRTAAEAGPVPPTGTVPEPESDLILRLSLARLVMTGATSGRVGPALGVLAGAFQLLQDVGSNDLWERAARVGENTTLNGVVVLIILLAIGAWVLAIGSTILTFAGFELRRSGDRLLISYGLLERRRSTIPLARVQAVTISEGVLRQPLGLASVRIESAGYGKDAAASGVLAPLLRRDEIAGLLDRACPDYAVDLSDMTLARLPQRARRRYLGGPVYSVLALTVILIIAAALIPGIPWTWGLWGLVLVPVMALWGLLRYRDTGWWLGDDDRRLVIRERRIDRLTIVTERRRLQHRSVHQNVLQRRAELATFGVAVASGGEGGRAHIMHLDAGTAFDLLARLRPPMIRRPQPATSAQSMNR